MKSDKKIEIASHLEGPKTPLDLWKWMGGKTQRIQYPEKPATDGLLAVYKDRLTYTFILEREVASIHYDRGKNEIFFKGHNIRNLELTRSQMASLMGLKSLLSQDEKGKAFLSDYEATLGRCLAENNKGGV